MCQIPEPNLEMRLAELSENSALLLKNTETAACKMQEYYPQLLYAEDRESMEKEVRDRMEILNQTSKNLWRAYQQTYDMQDELSARWRDIKKAGKKSVLFPSPPANTAIDLAENAAEHFAKGLNFYKLFCLGFIGSFLGVIIEMAWRLVTRGTLESRASLVSGPFNLIYGAAAIILTVCLYAFRNRGNWLSFLGGMLAATILEYVCSWGQEFVFGSKSWDYSHMPFNINGRVCLLFSIFWGMLGVLWIKNLYPRLTKWILKIPNRVGRIATWLLAAFLIMNTLITSVSVYRWSRRINGAEATNKCWELIDERFPDSRMEKIFPSMHFNKSIATQ